METTTKSPENPYGLSDHEQRLYDLLAKGAGQTLESLTTLLDWKPESVRRIMRKLATKGVKIIATGPRGNRRYWVKEAYEAYLDNNPEKAITILKADLNRNPENAEKLYSLGRAYYLQGHVRKAARVWQKTIKIDPRHPEAHFALATAYGLCGWMKEARKVAGKLKKLDYVLYQQVIEELEQEEAEQRTETETVS